MSPFVEECLREWRRLGVPDPVANEMAADLGADLAEAEAEGASAEDVLGSGAFDPRSFAAAWARERGVIPSPPQGVSNASRRSRVPAVISAFAVVAIAGALLAFVGAPSRTARVAFPSTFLQHRVTLVVPSRLRVIGPRKGIAVPRLRIVPAPPHAVGGSIVATEVNGSGWDLRPVGLLLLVAGIVGMIVSTLYWWPRRRLAA